MYLQHFGLSAKPFSLIPDPAYLFLSSQHSVAYSMLEYGLLEQQGITVITGEVGAGKTTLLRHLLNQHDEEELVVGLMANTQEGTARELMKWVALAFNLDFSDEKVGLLQKFQQFLIDNYAAGKVTVLIVDEAQNLTSKALEELRLLNNINAQQDELLKIILVGQPELQEQLVAPEMMQFAQRVTVEFHLNALTAADTLGYIRHRLEVAGAEHEIFDEPAMYAVYYLTGGVPRLLNTLCDYALVYAYSTGKSLIDIQSIVEVAKGRKIGGINKFIIRSEDMEKARDFIDMTTGVDIAKLVT